MGDLEGDGVNDMVVGANNGPNGGSVYLLFLNSDGSVKSHIAINSATPNVPDLADEDGFGSSVANMGDLDGNGFADLAVGAAGDHDGGFAKGAVYLLFLQENWTVKNTVRISDSTSRLIHLSNADNFGISVANVGDLNGDGKTDLAVGAIGDDQEEGGEGAVYILFLEGDGSLISVYLISSSTVNPLHLDFGDRFGRAIANIGDINNDGIAELAVGAEGTDGLKGSVFLLFFNENIIIDQVTEINGLSENGPSLSIFDLFGHAVEPVNDLDGDGIVDLAIGAQADDDGGKSTGAMYLIFLQEDGSVKTTIKINHNAPNISPLSAGGNFGSSIAMMSSSGENNTQTLAVGGNTVGKVQLLYLEVEILAAKMTLSTHSMPYPNPVQDNIRITNTKSIQGFYTIYNLMGKLLLTQHTSVQTHNIDVSDLSKGVYFLTAKLGNQNLVHRFVKE